MCISYATRISWFVFFACTFLVSRLSILLQQGFRWVYLQFICILMQHAHAWLFKSAWPQLIQLLFLLIIYLQLHLKATALALFYQVFQSDRALQHLFWEQRAKKVERKNYNFVLIIIETIKKCFIIFQFSTVRNRQLKQVKKGQLSNLHNANWS